MNLAIGGSLTSTESIFRPAKHGWSIETAARNLGGSPTATQRARSLCRRRHHRERASGTTVARRPQVASRRIWRMLRSLSPDGQTFFMTGAYNGEVGALMAVDLATGNETVMATDPKYDVENAFVHPLTREIQAVAFYRDQLDWRILDRTVARLSPRLPSSGRRIHRPASALRIAYRLFRRLGRRDLKTTPGSCPTKTTMGRSNTIFTTETRSTATFCLTNGRHRKASPWLR